MELPIGEVGSGSPQRAAIQRWFGIGFAGVSFAVALVNTITILNRPPLEHGNVVFLPYVGLIVLIGILSLISGFVRKLRLFQVVAILGVGIGSALASDRADVTSFVWLIVALLLAWEYGYFLDRGALKAGVVVVLFLLAWMVGLRSDGISVGAAVTSLIAAASIAAVGWVLIVLKGREQLRRERELERAVEARTAALQASLANRDLLLAELHHRTKNNLQLVSSLLWFEEHAIRDAATQSTIAAAQIRLQALARVHELLYTNTAVGDVDLTSFASDYLGEIAPIVDRSVVTLEWEIDVRDRVPTDFAVRFGLLLNELVLDASMGPQDAAGRVARISVRSDGGRLLIETSNRHTTASGPELAGGPPMAGDSDFAADADSEPAPGSRQAIGEQIIAAMAESLGGEAARDPADRLAWKVSVPLPPA